MDETLREMESELSDPAKYVRVPGRVIFDEHEEVYYEDPSGRPCKPDAKGAKRKVRRFTKGALGEIARRCNRRDRTGNLSPLAFGHTVLDGVDKDGVRVPAKESDQPAPVGYARNYKVGYSEALGRHVLLTDFLLKREKYEEAKTYPRVSVELWERHGIIDPIALIRKTPARDLGQWTYGRTGRVLRYSMEFQMDQPEMTDAPGGGMDDHAEKVEQFMRHCMSHPHAKHFAAHYAMPEEDETGGDEPDPTDLPDAEEEPATNGMAAPSATNASLPEKAKKPTQFAKDMDAVRYSKLEREIAELRADREQVKAERNLEVGRRLVATLVGEGFDLDADKEALRFSKMDETARTERMEEIRSNYKQAPVGYDRPVPLAQDRGASFDPEEPESMPLKDQEAVLQYQRKNNLWDLDFVELAARALPAKYGRKKE